MRNRESLEYVASSAGQMCSIEVTRQVAMQSLHGVLQASWSTFDGA